MTVIVRADPQLIVVPSAPVGATGAKGDPGGSAGDIGLFTGAGALTIPVGINIVGTSGYSALDVGAAVYVYDGAVDATYVAANPRTSFRDTAGRGFKLSREMDFTPQMFGAVADGVTDDSAAFVAAIAFLKSIAVNAIGGDYKASPKLFIPAGHYYLGATTLDITNTLIIEGEGGRGGAPASKLRWAAGATGIRIQHVNTSGATTVDGVTHFSGGGMSIRNVGLTGGFAGTEGEFHGIHLRAPATIENVQIQGFQGDGIYTNCVFGGIEGNANTSQISNARIVSNRNGIAIDGDNANIICVVGVDCSSNRQWGFRDSSFLGNTYLGCHSDFNGMTDGVTPCQVTQGGNRYVVKQGQESGASTNAPSGTTADNTWWYYNGAGGVNTSFNIRAWSSGTTYRAGGAYMNDDVNSVGTYLGCYSESGQPTSQIASPSVTFGGLHGAGNKGVPLVRGSGSRLRIQGGISIDNDIQVYGSDHFLGPGSDGTPSTLDTTFNLDNTNSYTLLQGRKLVSGAPTNIGSLMFSFGNGTIFDVQNAGWAHRFRVNGTGIVNVDSAGIDLQSGNVLKVGGAQIVGARGAAVADAATAAAAPTQAEFNALVTQFNLLLARLRATTGHGLIA